jgi:hypothetical protein
MASMKIGSLPVLVLLLAMASVAQEPGVRVTSVTEISADLGPCSAEFHVTDMNGKGIYNAKIHTLIRYGFLSKRKLELDAGTNSEGRARFVKLPGEAKRPIEFTVSNGVDKATRSYNPATDCHANFDIPLKTGNR